MTGFDAKREAALDKLVQEQERLGLYDPLPQREWVGLTEDEMLTVVHYSQLDNARAIEAKLKERTHEQTRPCVR